MTEAPPVVAQLEADGVTVVVGTVVNPAGLTLAKTVPVARVGAFAGQGLGASRVWHGFAVDQTGIAFTERNNVIGDQRMRIDLTALRHLGDGLAWAPGSLVEQDGTAVPECSRAALARIEAALAEAGFAALVGHEVEFVLVDPDGHPLPATLWAQYGLAGVLEHETFVRDVIAAADVAGVGIEQLHPEYGANQFELSLAPLSPVAAADQLVLTRLLLGRTARRHGLRVSLSPAPFVGDAGCGAHQHFSLTDSTGPLFSGGTGRQGMTGSGESALAGVLGGLPEAQGVLCGSIVSGLRLQPGNWAGAFACWGTENREAALRFVAGGPANPCGANVEVKVVDPSADPYLATATILGLALDGVTQNAELPAEITVDPAALSPTERHCAGVVQLSSAQNCTVAALHDSRRLRAILGDAVVDATVAVRRFEHDHYSHLNRDQLADKFRMAWSV